MQGYIKLFRKLVDWEWYGDPVVKSVFIDLLINANYKVKQWQGQTVNPGELVTSVSSIAERNGLSVQQVRTALKKLEKTGEINKRSTNKNTLIIVLNYRRYQELSDCETEDCNKQATNNQQSNNNQSTTTKKDKNVKKEKNEEKERVNTNISSLKSELFTPPSRSQVHQYILDNHLNVDAQRFIDYYSSNGWIVGRTPMKDWKAMLRNWSRSEKEKRSKSLEGLGSKPTYDIDEIERRAIYNDNYEV